MQIFFCLMTGKSEEDADVKIMRSSVKKWRAIVKSGLKKWKSLYDKMKEIKEIKEKMEVFEGKERKMKGNWPYLMRNHDENEEKNDYVIKFKEKQ